MKLCSSDNHYTTAPYKVSFYLWQMGPELKRKSPKYFDQFFLKILLLLSTFPKITRVFERSTHVDQKGSSIKKLPISKIGSFLKLRFNLNQMRNNAYTKRLNLGLGCFIFLLKI